MKVGIKALSTFLQVRIKEFCRTPEESIDQETLMYSQLSMVIEPSTNDCKPQSTHKTLGPVSRINGLKLMERDLVKGEH